MAKDLVFSIDIQGTDQEAKQLGLLQSELDKVKRSMKDLQKIEKQQGALTEKQSQERAKLRTQLVGTRNAYNDLQASILKNNNALRKNSGFVAGVRKGVEQWATSLIGVSVAIAAVSRGIGSAINVIKNFQQENARLASVLGKSRKEIVALTEDAKRLGASTAFTASQVAQLQTEFAKLGFSEQEILNATEATLSLAAATNTELAEAASVAGATVRGFGLSSRETQRVVDVMAKSFSSSALDMSKFSTAMAQVAPVAKNAGLTLEETTSALGILVDRGVDASTAGTALRGILLDLAGTGMTLDEAFEQINSSTNKNATAFDLFGKRGATVATILAENTDQADKLTTKLENAGGAAEKMANEQLDTLEGSLTKLSSAMEGLILNLEDGEGVLGSFLKTSVDALTAFIQGVQLIDGVDWALFLNPATWQEGLENIFEAAAAQEKWNQTLNDAKREVNEYANQLASVTNGTKEENIAIADNLFMLANQKQAKLDAGKVADYEIERAKALILSYEEIAKQFLNMTEAQKANTDAAEDNNDQTEEANKKEDERSGIISRLTDRIKDLNDAIRFSNDIQEIRTLQEELLVAENKLAELTNLPDNKKMELISAESVDVQIGRLGELADANRDIADSIVQVNADASDEMSDEWKDALRSIAAVGIDAAASLASNFFDQNVQKAQESADKETEVLQKKFDQGLISQGQYNRELEAIQKEVREKEKEAAIAQAIIDGASAALKAIALAGPPPISPAGIAGIAGAAITTAAQIAIIESQTFGTGGVFDGDSHENGGIKGVLNGKRIEVEGDEMWIANKKAKRSNKVLNVSGTAEQIISGINEHFGGTGWKKGAKISDRMEVDLTRGGSTFERMIQGNFDDSRMIKEMRRNTKANLEGSRRIETAVKMKTNGYY